MAAHVDDDVERAIPSLARLALPLVSVRARMRVRVRVRVRVGVRVGLRLGLGSGLG